MNPTLALRLAATFGFLAVALGALGAHGLEPRLVANGTSEMWKTAALYHLAHAIVLLVIAPRPGAAAWFFTTGILLFSGSLYIYALWKVKWLMPLTPVGGVCFLIGWVLVGLRRA